MLDKKAFVAYYRVAFWIKIVSVSYDSCQSYNSYTDSTTILCYKIFINTTLWSYVPNIVSISSKHRLITQLTTESTKIEKAFVVQTHLQLNRCNNTINRLYNRGDYNSITATNVQCSKCHKNLSIQQGTDISDETINSAILRHFKIHSRHSILTKYSK